MPSFSLQVITEYSQFLEYHSKYLSNVATCSSTTKEQSHKPTALPTPVESFGMSCHLAASLAHHTWDRKQWPLFGTGMLPQWSTCTSWNWYSPLLEGKFPAYLIHFCIIFINCWLYRIKVPYIPYSGQSHRTSSLFQHLWSLVKGHFLVRNTLTLTTETVFHQNTSAQFKLRNRIC